MMCAEMNRNLCAFPRGKHHENYVPYRTENIMVFLFRVYAEKYLPPKGGNSTECTLALRHARTVGKRLKSRRFPLPSIT